MRIHESSVQKTWLTTPEAACYLGKTDVAIWHLVSKGHLIKRKWGRRLFFKKSELDNLIENSFC
jgi:excisionase family DNA binding protein